VLLRVDSTLLLLTVRAVLWLLLLYWVHSQAIGEYFFCSIGKYGIE
jgi:hypothetical protein